MKSRPSPAVLTGDLNLLASDVEPAFEQAGLSAVPTGPTFPFPSPRRRIDWMGVRGLEVVSSGTVPVYGRSPGDQRRPEAERRPWLSSPSAMLRTAQAESIRCHPPGRGYLR
jgi:hypothetical protein